MPGTCLARNSSTIRTCRTRSSTSNEPWPVREDVHLVRVLPRRELVDVEHRLPDGAAAVVLADDEEHGRADFVREVDRVAIAHQFGNILRLAAAEERPIVCLQER